MLPRLSLLALAAGLLSSGPYIVVPVSALSPKDIPSDTPISSLLASAQAHLSKGEANEALVYYDARRRPGPIRLPDLLQAGHDTPEPRPDGAGHG